MMKLQNFVIQEFLRDHIIQFTHIVCEELLPEELKRHAEDDTVHDISRLKPSPSLFVMLKYVLIICLFSKIIVFIHLFILIEIEKAQS